MAEWADAKIVEIRERIERLCQLGPDELVPCEVCGGQDPRWFVPEKCGCLTGLQVVRDAIRHLHGEVDILFR